MQYKYLYVPTPEHWVAPGIPARNLTAEEVELYGEQSIINAQCYQLVEPDQAEPETEPEE